MEAIEEWSASTGLDDAWLGHLFGKCCEDNQGLKDIISDRFSWFETEFFVCEGFT